MLKGRAMGERAGPASLCKFLEGGSHCLPHDGRAEKGDLGVAGRLRAEEGEHTRFVFADKT